MSKHKKTIVKNPKQQFSLDGYVGLPYLRVSSKRQEIEGTGLQSQEKRCLMELSNIGIPHEKSFFDSYTGGGDFMNRPAMRSLLAYVDAHPHKKFVVIFDDLKRFARDTEFHLKLRLAFKNRGIVPKCLNYNFDDSPEGMFVETVLAASNELERKQNARQVVQKQKARLEAGYRAFPSVKGYTRVKDPIHGKIDIQNELAIYVKEALEGFASMRFVHKIDGAKFLQEKGVISKKQNADKAISTFDKMLREVFYAGYIEYEPWEVNRRVGHHKSLIGLDTFNKNQNRLIKNAVSFTRQDIREGFELRGLINCAYCNKKYTGGPSTGRSGKKYNLYKCPTVGCERYGKSISTKIVHTHFEDLLKNIKPCEEIIDLAKSVFEEVWNEEIKNRSSLHSSIIKHKNDLENDISTFTDRISKAVETGASELVIKQYEKQIHKIATELEDLEENISLAYDYSIPYRTASEEVLGVLKSPYAVWKNYNPAQKQRFFSFIFETNLIYSKEEGYRTPSYSLPIRIFEEISTSKPLDVELGGIEPPCRKCVPRNLHVYFV